MFLFEQILVTVAQLHHRAHVDLVEGRQHGGGVLRLLKSAGDGLAQAAQAHPLLAPRVLGRARALGGGGAGAHFAWRRGGGTWIDDAGAGAIKSLLRTCPRLPEPADRREINAAGRGRFWRPRARAALPAAPETGADAAARRRRGLRRREREARLGARAAPSVIWPSSAPGVTVSPSLATISARTPDAGALTSSVTLSVSSSASASSARTASPGCLNQRPIVASVTDSPRVGTRISVIAASSIDLATA